MPSIWKARFLRVLSLFTFEYINIEARKIEWTEHFILPAACQPSVVVYLQ